MILFPAPGPATYGDTLLMIDGLMVGLDVDGVTWVFESLAGWRHGGGVDTTFTPRPNAHGAMDGQAYRRERVIVVGGLCVAESPESAEVAAENLAAVLADGSLGTMSTSSPHGYRSARVRLSDTPMSEWLSSVTFRWSLQFTAPDWRKYGDTQSGDTGLPGGGTGLAYPLAYPLDYGDPGNTGRVSFTNSGDAATEPTFTVSGPLSVGFEITRVETGERLRYEHPVGTDLTVDCAAGTVTEAGQRRERYLTVRQWPSVGRGETATFQFSTLGPETYSDPAHLSGQMAPAYP